MSIATNAYNSIADVNLWLKLRDNDDLTLADVPSIIPLRWTYFVNSWNFLVVNLQNIANTTYDPDLFNSQLSSFTQFIESQRFVPPSVNPFANSLILNKYYFIFDNINIEDINITNIEQTILTNQQARVNLFSKNDFLNAQNNIIIYRDTLTDQYGLGDTTYNTTVGRSPVAKQVTGDIPNVNYLLQLQYSIKTIDFILANLFAVDDALDPFALARANANNPDINIGQYSSGTLVKLNYGESLATLAYRYFGDPNKWIDIAIANGLEPPYIDEEGQALPLIANGNGNQINIAGTDSNGNSNYEKLYITQPVFLQSSTQVVVSQRSITNIRQIPISGEIVIEVDGAANMTQYTIVSNATVRVYKPGTINSSFYILIPSQEPLPNNRQEEIPWFLMNVGNDLQRMKVDLAIDNNNELNFTSSNDVALSYGLENAIQAMKLKIITELGSLRYHPTFGLASIVGKTNADISALQNLLTQSLTDQVSQDSRFDRIESLSVDYLVNPLSATSVAAILIQLDVRLAGGTNVVPISFSVNIV